VTDFVLRGKDVWGRAALQRDLMVQQPFKESLPQQQRCATRPPRKAQNLGITK